MEKENRKGLIYEFPMGVAVLKGGHHCRSISANAEFMKAIGHGEQAEPERSRDFYDCVYLQDAGVFEDMIEMPGTEKGGRDRGKNYFRAGADLLGKILVQYLLL